MSPSTRNTVAWILQALLAFAFTSSGFLKFLHLAGTIQTFEQMGLPAWLVYIVGAAEVLGGIGLLAPRLVRPAAIGLGLIMAAAVFIHGAIIPGGLFPKGMPALLLLFLLGLVAQLRRSVPA